MNYKLDRRQALSLLKNIPYTDQITGIDHSSPENIYFEWRGNRYKFNLNCAAIELSVDGTVIGTDTSALMTELIRVALNKGKYEESGPECILKNFISPIMNRLSFGEKPASVLSELQMSLYLGLDNIYSDFPEGGESFVEWVEKYFISIKNKS